MQLTPLGPTEPTRPHASASLVKQSVEQLIQDGVEILGQRKLGPVSLGVKRLTSFEEIANRLGREVLQLILPGMVAVPLKGAEELQAAVALQSGQPTEALARPDLARDLKELAAQGWRFYNSEGEIGLFGAYSSIGQQPVEARRGVAKVELMYVEACQHMARFYAGDSLAAELEKEGYQFFAQSGRPEAAFHASKHSTVGKDGQSWVKFEARDPELLRRSLQRFEQLVSQGGTPDTARQAVESWRAVQHLTTPQDISAHDRSQPGIRQALIERLSELESTRPAAELVLAASRTEPDRGPELFEKLLQTPDAPMEDLILRLLPPDASSQLCATLLAPLSGTEKGLQALAAVERVQDPLARSEAVAAILGPNGLASHLEHLEERGRSLEVETREAERASLVRPEESPERLRYLSLKHALEVNPASRRALVDVALEAEARRDSSLGPAVGLTRQLLAQDHRPWELRTVLSLVQRNREPARMPSLVRGLLDTPPREEVFSPTWSAAWSALERCPGMEQASAFGKELAGRPIDSGSGHRLFKDLLGGAEAGKELTGTLVDSIVHLILSQRKQAPFVGQVVEALWKTSQGSPEFLDEARRLSHLAEGPSLRLLLSHAMLEKPGADPLESAVTMLARIKNAPPLTLSPEEKKQAEELSGTFEQALVLKRSQSQTGIQEQSSRVVVGGTFIRKRNS